MATTYFSADLEISEHTESENLSGLMEDAEDNLDVITDLIPDAMIYECEGNCKRIPKYVFVDGEWYAVKWLRSAKPIVYDEDYEGTE